MTYNYCIFFVFRYIYFSKKENNMPRKSPYIINLTENEHKKLLKTAHKYTSPYYLVMRAKVILLCAQGVQNKEIGEYLDLPRQIVSKWRKRFFYNRMDGLHDQPRKGRPSNS